MAGFQELKVSRALRFQGVAALGDNVEGNPSTKKLVWCDDFTQVTLDATNDYVVTVAETADSVAINAQVNGAIRMTAGDTDNDVCYIGNALIFDISKNPVVEFRIDLPDVSVSALYCGFSDANTETSQAATIDYASGTLAAAATDAAGFVVDADKESSLIYAASIASGGGVAAATTGITLTDASNYVVYRIALNTEGDATYSVNGVQTNIVQAAVTDVPLCFIINNINRATGTAGVLDIDYIKAWQDR